MLLNQGDVVEVYFPFPGNKVLPHPVIVLSIQSVLNCEETFIGVPISHSDNYNENAFSFPLYDTYFEKSFTYKNSYARLHLIMTLRLSDLVQQRKTNTMKKRYFLQMFDEIQTSIFGCGE